MDKHSLAGLAIVGLLVWGGTFRIGAGAQVISPAPAPPPLSKAIVGTWRGEAIVCDKRVNFGRIPVEIRFTDYGIATVREAAWDSGAAGCGNTLPAKTLNADYVVVGSNVLLSPHGGDRSIVTISNITISEDKLEAVSTAVLGNALVLTRQ